MKVLYNILTFMISAFFVFYTFWNWRKGKTETTNQGQNVLSSKWTAICFGMFLVLACLCRLYRFGEFPFLNQDSAMAAKEEFE